MTLLPRRIQWVLRTFSRFKATYLEFPCMVMLASVLGFSFTTSYAVPFYSITDIGNPESVQAISTALGINNRGQVVGKSQFTSSAFEGFVRSTEGEIIRLGPNGCCGFDSTALDINDQGEIVGFEFHTFLSSPTRALKWDENLTAEALTTPFAAFATAINSSGDVVGRASASGQPSVARLWKSTGEVLDLGVLPGTAASFAASTNDSREVVGHSGSASGIMAGALGFIWNESGGIQSLGFLEGETDSFATDINATGQIVGGSGSRAVLWNENHEILNLGSLPTLPADATDTVHTANAINDAGIVVGSVGPGRLPSGSLGNLAAFIWTEHEGILDLTDLVTVGGEGWTVTSANDINDRGEIVGSGLLNGVTRAFLLTPIVPEPSGLSINLTRVHEGERLGPILGGFKVGGAPALSGDGTLDGVVAAAAAWWEAVFPNDDRQVNIEYGWGNRLIGGAGIVPLGDVPGQSALDAIVFNNGVGNFFADATPETNDEFPFITTKSKDFGAGAMTSERVLNSTTFHDKRDLFSIALHEIGHLLGFNSNNLALELFTLKIEEPLDFAGAVLPLESGSLLPPQFPSFAHFDDDELPFALMSGAPALGQRIYPSVVDVMGVAQAGEFILPVDGAVIGGGDVSVIINQPGGAIAGRIEVGADTFGQMLISATELSAERVAVGRRGIMFVADGSTLIVGDEIVVGAVGGRGELWIGNGSRVVADTVTIGSGGKLKAGCIPLVTPADACIDGTLIVNGGTVEPGNSAGILTIDGNLFFENGVLEIEIGGLNDGDFDVVKILGAASFTGGTILFSFIDEFLPETGDFVDFLIAGDLDMFENVSFAFSGVAPGFQLGVVPTAGFGRGLRFVALNDATTVPEPSTRLLLMLGLMTVLSFSNVVKYAKKRC